MDNFRLDGRVALVTRGTQGIGQAAAIAPGYMATANTTTLRTDPVRYQPILDRIPAGRWGNADEIQGTIVFLASAASNYLHGAMIPVDGGWLGR